MIERIFKTSEFAAPRSLYKILVKAMEELGELAQEVAIKTGDCDKPVGKDGIIGEAIDAIICLVDLMKVHKPDITIDEINQIVAAKLAKWESQEIKADKELVSRWSKLIGGVPPVGSTYIKQDKDDSVHTTDGGPNT